MFDEKGDINGEYPLVHLLHGGPNSSWVDEFHMRFNASLLASHGYVVAMVNFRGSTGTPTGESGKPEKCDKEPPESFLGKLREDASATGVGIRVSKLVKKSKEEVQNSLQDAEPGDFRKIARHANMENYVKVTQSLSGAEHERLIKRKEEVDVKGWGANAVKDVDWVTEKLLELRCGEKRVIDPDRIAVIGGSYGAFLGARLLGWKDRKHNYKAFVLHAGVYDAMSFFATDAFWVQYQNFGDRPWRRKRKGQPLSLDFDDGDPEPWRRFSRISPLLRSHRLAQDIEDPKIQTPAVLVTHGLDDLRVPWQQSVLLHRMLKDRGATSRLALYPGLGHRLDQPEASVQWWAAAMKWLEDHGVRPGGE